MKILLLLLGIAIGGTAFADDTAINRLLENREIAWEKQDVSGLIAPFAEDSDYIDSSGKITTGRKAIEQNYTRMFASAHYKNSRSTQKITKVRLVRPDVAVVDAEWTLKGLQNTDDQPLPDRKGSTVLVIVRESQDWKIVTLRVALTPPEISKDQRSAN